MTDELALWLHPTIEDVKRGKMTYVLLTQIPAGGKVEIDFSDIKKALERELKEDDDDDQDDYVDYGHLGWAPKDGS
jgi:hypothetical protein